jgi:hypothetical protein
MLLIVADGTLIAYRLDGLKLPGTELESHAMAAAPQKISSRNVKFHYTWKHRDRELVMFATHSGLSTTFKLIEPMVRLMIVVV